MIAKRVVRKFKIRTQFRMGKDGEGKVSLANSRSFPNAKKKLAGKKDQDQSDVIARGRRRTQGDKLKDRVHG